MSHSLRTTFLLSAFSLFIILLSSNAVAQQLACGFPPLIEQPPLGKRNTWAKDSVIPVYIASAFSDEQEEGIRDALANWQAVRTTNLSGVTFNINVGPLPTGQTGSFIEIRMQAPPGGIPNATDRGAVSTSSGSTWLADAIVYLNPIVTLKAAVTEVVAHELGHTFGLDDCPECFLFDSVMANAPFGINPNRTGRTKNPSNCDNQAVALLYESVVTPTPEPTPVPTPISWCTDPTFCGLDFEYCLCAEFGGYWDPFFCNCWYYSPILIDVNGDGFRLSDAPNGVAFDLTADGVPEQLGWTRPGTDDGWLVLDRNNNGVIDDGTELFGNYSPQPQPRPGVAKNGFLALAEYDKPENGGNSDGVISRRDQIFRDLRIWQDNNHNGFSELHELRELEDVGLRKISLDYSESNRVDQHGNRFKFRARVLGAQDAQLGRWAWDVYLVSQGLSGVNLLMRNFEIYSLAKPKCRPRVDKML